MSWEKALPAIGAFLGGPAGNLVGSGIEWLAEKCGASDKTVEGIKQTLSGMTSDQLVEMKKIDIEFQKFCMENNIKIDLAQIGVNEKEALSDRLFVAGWRPFCGWIGGVSLGYAGIVEPLLRFVSQVAFGYKGLFPVIDTSLTLQILMGLLGLGALRSFDNQTGPVKKP